MALSVLLYAVVAPCKLLPKYARVMWRKPQSVITADIC